MRRLVVLIGAAGLLTAQTNTGDAARGKELYVKYSCYACHSFDGHDGAGARLFP